MREGLGRSQRVLRSVHATLGVLSQIGGIASAWRLVLGRVSGRGHAAVALYDRQTGLPHPRAPGREGGRLSPPTREWTNKLGVAQQ